MQLPEVSIHCEQLCKKYPLQSQKSNEDKRMALNNISFTLHEGEVLGIIGANGSGKTTLLKILSGIIKPTAGKVSIRGNVLSIIDIGSEFNPDLSGEENIRISAALLLGASKSQIDTLIKDIVVFSELEDYINEPLKNYSMGMYLRLAMSIILFFRPDVLIIDEVLSVGDAYFMAKSFPKLNEIVERGTTVVFASHNLKDILSFTRKCMWLDAGQIRLTGATQEIVPQYLLHNEKLVFKPDANTEVIPYIAQYNATSKSDEHYILQCAIFNQSNNTIANKTIDYEDGLNIQFYLLNKPSKVGATIYITDTQNQTIITTSPYLTNEQEYVTFNSETIAFTCFIPPRYLNIGRYFVNIIVFDSNNEIVEQRVRVLSFGIDCQNERLRFILEKIPVKTIPDFTWHIEPISS